MLRRCIRGAARAVTLEAWAIAASSGRSAASIESEDAVLLALGGAFPTLSWQASDSSWDKVAVGGESASLAVAVMRRESPGPFRLTVVLKGADHAAGAELAVRDAALGALDARLWTPLEPQRVALVKDEGRFPPLYELECNLELHEIKRILDDAELGSWELYEKPRGCFFLRGTLPPYGRPQRAVRIRGTKPRYRLEVDGRAANDDLHELIQTTLLPGIGARNLRAVPRAFLEKCLNAGYDAAMKFGAGKPRDVLCPACGGLLDVDGQERTWLVRCPCGMSNSTFKGL